MIKIVGIAAAASFLALFASNVLLTRSETGAADKAASGTGARAAVTAQPGQPQAVALAADSRGHFVTEVKINGMFVKGLVDTGATSVAIPADVARTIGITVSPSDRVVRISTANGETSARMVRLREVRISTIVVPDVEAVIVDKGLPITLVGMSFIRRISSEMRGSTLVLRQ
jgi:aspartyl protease family protein